MRDHYNTLGVDNYYTKEANSYRNQHYPDIVRVVHSLMNQLDLNPTSYNGNGTLVGNSNYSIKFFDLAAGSGEATLALLKWAESSGVGVAITATDPFTHSAYETRTGYPCLHLSFQDIANGMTGNFDLVICSFALHLAPESLLFALLHQISNHTRFFVILSPTKKPLIKEMGDFVLVHNYVQDRIHVRVFESLNYSPDYLLNVT